MVICNGPRKAGTNALRYVVRELGFSFVPGGIISGRYYRQSVDQKKHNGTPIEQMNVDGVIGSHSPHIDTDHKVITILRDPRNIAVSAYRARCKDLGIEATDFNGYINDTMKQFVAITKPYFNAEGCVVWYERLFDRETVKKISQYLEVAPKQVSSAWGKSGTWTGNPSNWKQWFNSDTEERLKQSFGRTVNEIFW